MQPSLRPFKEPNSIQQKEYFALIYSLHCTRSASSFLALNLVIKKSTGKKRTKKTFIEFHLNGCANNNFNFKMLEKQMTGLH